MQASTSISRKQECLEKSNASSHLSVSKQYVLLWKFIVSAFHSSNPSYFYVFWSHFIFPMPCNGYSLISWWLNYFTTHYPFEFLSNYISKYPEVINRAYGSSSLIDAIHLPTIFLFCILRCWSLFYRHTLLGVAELKYKITEIGILRTMKVVSEVLVMF